MTIINFNVKRNWVKWLEEQNRPVQPTELDLALNDLVKEITEIGNSRKWIVAEIFVRGNTVHLDYTTPIGLFCIWIPIQDVLDRRAGERVRVAAKIEETKAAIARLQG